MIGEEPEETFVECRWHSTQEACICDVFNVVNSLFKEPTIAS
jgi:hypothetical protein